METSFIIFLIVAILLILSTLLFPKIKLGKMNISLYWVIVLFGAILSIILGNVSINDLKNVFISNNSSNPLKILILFFSMTFLSIFLDEVGVFSHIAKRVTRIVKHSQIKFFSIIYILCSVLTIFTSNDIVILTFTPFIIYFSKHCKVNPIPYLIGEFVAANTWSMMLLIGNPTNIYLGLNANINFVDYFLTMSLPTLGCGLVQFILLILIFKNKLKIKINVENSRLNKLDKLDVIVGSAHLFCCLICLILSNYIELEMYLFSLGFALSLLLYILFSSIFKKENRVLLKGTIKRLPYSLIPFVLGMFIIVFSLTNNGISNIFSKILNRNCDFITYGYSSFLMCNVMNNIPMSILYSSFVISKESIYASIIGSNIGAFLTPIGALAGIMFTALLAKYGVKFSFLDFTKYGVILSIPTITIALLILKLVLSF